MHERHCADPNKALLTQRHEILVFLGQEWVGMASERLQKMTFAMNLFTKIPLPSSAACECTGKFFFKERTDLFVFIFSGFHFLLYFFT